MRMIEYYRLNKSVVANLFTKIGSVMVFLISLIYLFTSLPIDSIETFISILFVSVVLGNFIALSILVLVFQIEYVSFKTQNEFFKTLKVGWISEFDCRMSFFYPPFKYSFLQSKILFVHNHVLFSLVCEKSEKQVWIDVLNTMEDVDFDQICGRVDKVWANQSVIMTGYGLRKKISLKEWTKMSKAEFCDILSKLIEVSEIEGLDVTLIDKDVE